MQLFHIPEFDKNNTDLIISKEESKHIVRVLRLKNGDFIHITNGKGVLAKAEIIDDNKNACKVRIVEVIDGHEKRDYYVHMAVAPTKNNDRYEWFIEKATEFGLDEITPIICNHSERKTIKTERLNKVILSAAKQSLKAYIPKVNEAVKLDVFLNSDSFDGQKFVAHCIKEDKKSLKSELKPNNKYLILIGPEGDFSKSEVDLAISKGFTPVTLGNFRLRTETAALAAVHSIAFVNE